MGIIAIRTPGHICLFFVDKSYHGHGIGRNLFEASVQYCREEFLCEKDNGEFFFICSTDLSEFWVLRDGFRTRITWNMLYSNAIHHIIEIIYDNKGN